MMMAAQIGPARSWGRRRVVAVRQMGKVQAYAASSDCKQCSFCKYHSRTNRILTSRCHCSRMPCELLTASLMHRSSVSTSLTNCVASDRYASRLPLFQVSTCKPSRTAQPCQAGCKCIAPNTWGCCAGHIRGNWMCFSELLRFFSTHPAAHDAPQCPAANKHSRRSAAATIGCSPLAGWWR